MEPKMVCQILLAVFFSSPAGALPHPSNNLRECRKNNSLLGLEVLPGGGWDNLRNRDMGRVMNFSYSQCQTTEDGIYLIPDEVFVIPQKMTAVQKGSEVIEHWLNHSSSTSQTINADASFLSVLNGKFSTDSKRIKTFQVRDHTVTSRLQVRNHIYTVDAYPDFTLDSRFTQQVKEIADALVKNNTRRTTFLSEMMVVDYGTHVITSVGAGAILEQEDYIESDYYHSSVRSQLSTSASLNFFKGIKFDMDTKTGHETAETTTYETHLTHSQIESHGGTMFYPGITLKTWQESIPNNLVAIDRAGIPLHYILNRVTLPDLPEATVQKLSQSVAQAIQRYYDINKRPGCVDPMSSNFNFQANVDDNSCTGPETKTNFGGVYQTCTSLTQYSYFTRPASEICKEQEQKNPATGEFSCKEPYSSVLLQSVVIEDTKKETYTHRDCDSFCLFDCCEEYSGVNYYIMRARVDTFWCVATIQPVEPFSGYLFGGIYGPSFPNPLTRSKSCPDTFVPMKFLSSGFMICQSNDYEQATSLSVNFGGFFSCRAGNPLAGSESRCPPNFSQHLATVNDGCQIMYCVQSGAFTGGQLQPIHLPPFTHPALIREVSNTSWVMITEEDQVWLRIGESNSWQRVKQGEVGRYMRQLQASRSTGGRIVAGCSVAFSIILAIGIALVVQKKIRGWSNRHWEDYRALPDTRRGGYETFPNTHQDQGV